MANNLFAKYIWEVNIINQTGRITMKELSDKWENCHFGTGEPLSRKTFNNHRQKIEELFNLHIKCDKRTNEYFIVESEDFRIGKVRNWLIRNFEVNDMLLQARGLQDRIILENVPSGEVYLIGIIQAIKENKIIQITHHSFWKSQSYTFEIMPYCLKLFKQRWYLLAQNENFDELKLYGLDRIEHLEITDKSFKYPKDFDAEDYFSTAYGVIQNDDTMSEIVRLKVRNNQAVYFRTLPLHHSQKEVEVNKDYSIFEYYLKPTYDFKQEILSNGYNVEVLEPLWLREEMIEIIEEMIINYK